MKSVLTVLACAAMLLGLWGLLKLSGQDFWWQYPQGRSWLVVGMYVAAFATLVLMCLAGMRLLFAGRGIRVLGAAAVLVGGWLILPLVDGATLRAVEQHFTIASRPLQPATVSYKPDTRRISITGDLRIGSAARFKDVLAASPGVELIEIDGPGGLINEAKWISHQIEQRGLDTLITDKCASACVDVFAAGRRRYMYPQAIVGLHSASSVPGDERGVEEENRAFAERLHRIGVEPRFLMIGTETPADGLWVNTARQAYLAGLATAIVEPQQPPRP